MIEQPQYDWHFILHISLQLFKEFLLNILIVKTII